MHKRILSLNEKGFDHLVVALIFVVGFAVIGTYYLVSSHAAAWTGELQLGYSKSSCLDNNGGTSKSGNKVDVWTCNATPAQSWSIVSVGSNKFQLKDAAGTCLDDYGNGGSGSRVVTYGCNANDHAQIWSWQASKLENAYQGVCINDPAYKTTNGTQLIVYSCNAKTAGSSNELWFEAKLAKAGSSSSSSSSSTSSGGGTTASTSDGCTSGGAAAPCIGSATTGASGWVLAFNDEFNGTSLNTSVWNPNGWTNNNMSSGSKASYVTESGGDLILQSGGSNSGAQVETSSTADALAVGDVAEARVEFKGPGSGAGTSIYNWPAWWVSGPNWPAAGENDIAESFSGSLSVNYHSPSGANNGPQQSQKMSNAFHTYTIERFSNKVEVWWDGQLIRSYSTNDNGQPENLIFTNGDGNTSQTGAAGEMLVDYVRVWKP